ncbi:MAG TPA: hypothetical protein VHF65_05975 [Nitrososphaera sp.]|nr:hypothetical protein [Nitrososphaera sp.]
MPKKNKLKNKRLIMLIVMAKAKSKQKKGKQANVSKTRKKSDLKKKSTSKIRKDGKKKATRRKASSLTKTRRVKTVPSPAAFTEIASEEVTSPMPAQGEQEMLESTEPTGVGKSEFTSIDDNNNTNSL